MTPVEARLEGYEAARRCALSVLASLKRELGDLDRISAWLVVHGLINAAPGFGGTAGVVNGFSDLILALYGPEAGTHARTRRRDPPAEPRRLRSRRGRDNRLERSTFSLRSVGNRPPIAKLSIRS